jgi:hypothetical protein
MKFIRSCFFICLLLLASSYAFAKEYEYPYTFFVNSRMEGNYFYSNGKYSGSSFIQTINNKLPVSKETFHTPGNALQLKYTNGRYGSWEAKLFRQSIRGQDHFKKADHLSLWIFVEPTSKAALPSIQLIRRDSSLTPAHVLSDLKPGSWQRILIPFSAFDIASDAMNSIRGVTFTQTGTDGLSGLMFIDDVEFSTNAPAKKITIPPFIINATGFAKHVEIEWPAINDDAVRHVTVYRSEDAGLFKPMGIQHSFTNRYADYTGVTGKKYSYKIAFVNDDYESGSSSTPVAASTKSMTDDELLTMVQEASFRYYWEGAEVVSGLAKENIPGRHNMIASGASGFGIMALIVGTERNFITRQQSVERFLQITKFLEQAETFHGAFSHFIDGPTGKVEPFFGQRDNGGDLVETSFLIQGLLAARAYFNKENGNEKMIRDRITAIWRRVEWDWYRRYPDSKFLYWHWSPDKEWVINHRLIGWNETMVTYLLAIASPTHAIPASMYYTGWANQDSTGQQYRTNWGGTTDGSMYSNGKTYFDIKLDVGVSNGGPLFFTHYSYMGYDPHHITDKYTNYFTNNQNIAKINYRYCVQNPEQHKGYGDSCWGLTACDGPYRYNANEPVPRQDHGIMAPTGAVSSFPYMPKEAMKALKNYYHNYGRFLWGEYGFIDAFSLDENWCSEIYMGLNQAPMVVMIENERTGLIWRLFMSNKEIQAGLDKIAAVK